MRVASDPPVGNGSNFNTTCILPLLIIPPSFNSQRSVAAETRFPEVSGGFVCLGHKTGSGGPRGLVFQT